MVVGAFVNAEIEKRGTMISEKRALEILECMAEVSHLDQFVSSKLTPDKIVLKILRD